MFNNRYLENIIEKVKSIATKDSLLTVDKVLANAPETITGHVFDEHEQILIRKDYEQAFSVYLKSEFENDFIVLQELINHPGWALFINLVNSQNPPEKKFDSLLQEMAFNQYRREILQEFINIPKKIVDYYSEIQKK